jgi:hypothetical protein
VAASAGPPLGDEELLFEPHAAATVARAREATRRRLRTTREVRTEAAPNQLLSGVTLALMVRRAPFAHVVALALASLATSLLTAAPPAAAFCGFYVAQGDKPLTNDATMVVLMREGTRTVLAMQNDYAGPPEDFAMVVPVPIVLEKQNVRTLPSEVFAHVDQMTAPRLVEYWEQDPCQEDADESNKEGGTGTRAKGEEGAMGNPRSGRQSYVSIEARFTVGEYDVVILASNDSLALDTWLRSSGYHIPAGAESVLRGYVAAGSLFFVAKVDAQKVHFSGGRARLSPLRFHYDTDRFTLPVRLGLLNSAGHQDLIVNIVGHSRYDAANYPHATIPTNLELDESARSRFPEFYAALFDRTAAKNPRAVVTEYSWAASSCDPCPGPVLSPSELDVLGADVLPKSAGGNWVLTRLHARYSKDTLGDDLVFAEAPAIQGGRDDGAKRTDAVPASINNFQGRYIVRHPWLGPMNCASPDRGMWGPPPVTRGRLPPLTRDPGVVRGKLDLASVLRNDAPTIGIEHKARALDGEVADDAADGAVYSPRARREEGLGLFLGAALGAAVSVRRRRQERPRG